MKRIDQRIINLYDAFTHGAMPRREFVAQLARLAGGMSAALALVPLLENDYSAAGIPAPEDESIETDRVEYPGASGRMRAYLARPAGNGRHPAVVIIHENRGLNPHIEDVARRAAAAGFLACAPDALSPLGGTPADADAAREMIGKLDAALTERDFMASLNFARDHAGSTGSVGCVGFCWGGGMANRLAVASPFLAAAVAFYGRQAPVEDVPKIRAALLLHYAGKDERINAGIADYEAALKKASVRYELHMYQGVQHAFHNDTNAARYDEAAAKLAWKRTIEFLERHLRDAGRKPDETK